MDLLPFVHTLVLSLHHHHSHLHSQIQSYLQAYLSITHVPYQSNAHQLTATRRSTPVIILLLKYDININHSRPLTLVSGDIKFVRIFAGVLWRGGVKRQWGDRKCRFSEILDAMSSAP